MSLTIIKFIENGRKIFSSARFQPTIVRILVQGFLLFASGVNSNQTPPLQGPAELFNWHLP